MRYKQSTSTRGQESGVRGQLRKGFTLTELLVVIAIIAALASLIAAAAVNAWNNAKRNRVVLEIKNISTALEDFKTQYGAYPPNGMNPLPAANPPSGSEAALVQADFERMFRSAFPRHQEPPQLILALCGQRTGAPTNENLPNGMTAAEALCFWLGGFSEDEQYPISGPGGPSFPTNDPTSPGEVLENRNWRYEFDVTRLSPRTDEGQFNQGSGRFLNYQVNLNGNNNATDPGEQRRIHLWRYLPKGSQQPLLYFDVSRYKPYQYDAWASPSNYIFALKQLRSGATALPTNDVEYQNNVVFVDQGKYQVLHSGLDDAWGDESETQDCQRMSMDDSTGLGWGTAQFNGTGNTELLLYPTGPFLGDIGDNLTSVADGTLAEVAEEAE